MSVEGAGAFPPTEFVSDRVGAGTVVAQLPAVLATRHRRAEGVRVE